MLQKCPFTQTSIAPVGMQKKVTEAEAWQRLMKNPVLPKATWECLCLVFDIDKELFSLCEPVMMI